MDLVLFFNCPHMYSYTQGRMSQFSTGVSSPAPPILTLVFKGRGEAGRILP